MDLEELRRIANEELEEAAARFWARVGKRADVEEHFAAAVAAWLAAWAESYLVPEDAPMDPDLEQKWLDQVARAERDLELRGKASGPSSERAP